MKSIGTKRLETDRLILRRFVVEDAEDMYNNWASDSEVTKFLTWPTHASVDVTRELLENWVAKYEEDNYYNWAIELKENGQVIGNISVVRMDEIIEAAEIGYCMSKTYWGREIMPEALKAVMKFLFDEAEFNRIVARHDANNAKSGRVMDKAGMIVEGTLRQAGKNNLGLCDIVVHAQLRSDRA